MTNEKYILNATGQPVAEPDVIAWGTWFEQSRDQRRVCLTERDGVKVSTVFLGLDHRWDDGPPILWETMVFGGDHEGDQDRCGGTREQAEAMHARMCAKVWP